MYSAIAENKRKTAVIMALFVGLIAGLGWVFSALYADGNSSVFVGVLVGAGLYTLISYYASSKIALSVNGARQIQKRDNPRLYRIVENLSITEGMPMPKVYIIDDPALNAFATGRNPEHASVAATTGLLEALDDSELEGVMAHELGHIKNYDIRVGMVAFAMVAVIGLIADIMLRISWFGGRDDDESSHPLLGIIGLVAIILAPLAAMLIQMAISRQREYLADATGALTTRYPEGLAGALQKIGHYGSATQRQNASTAHLYFANPLKGRSFSSLFSTHPPIADRISRLHKIGKEV